MAQLGTQEKPENIQDMEHSALFRSNQQKPSTIPSRECYNCIWALVAQLVPKYLRDIESVKTEKFKFELDKFLDTIPDQPKMPNYVTASGSNSILD